MSTPPYIVFTVLAAVTGFSIEAKLDAPRSVSCFDPAELTVTVVSPAFKNPFTDAELKGVFSAEDGTRVFVPGFCDAADGSVFRLRFAPAKRGTWRYELKLEGGGMDSRFTGDLLVEPSDRPGPVIIDPEHPRHFVFAGSRKPFYHLGYTAYHLVDPSNDAARIDATIAYCAEQGFNKLRFLLVGYPRDLDARTSSDAEFGVPDPKKRPNYGAPPGQVNPLPAWQGKPHAYDFTRFHVDHWRRVDGAVRRMRERGIVATCIVTIEKQDLPREYGRLTEDEYRLYRYAIARLAAFDNVWWDLGNEHNEYRNAAWGEVMGRFVKETDPYGRLASAHAYEQFSYGKSAWADFIITQQYGDGKAVHDWVLRHRAVQKPYVNEEYGYEDAANQPGHGQSADWTRRCHWAIALGGGYATYGDWSGGVSYYYTGEPGPGVAARQLKHVRTFFEALPFRELTPRDDLTSSGFCLATPPGHFVFYFPGGGECEMRLEEARRESPVGRWFDPRTGVWREASSLSRGKNIVSSPGPGDWALHVKGE